MASSAASLDLTKIAAARIKLIHPGTPYAMPYCTQAVFALIIVECRQIPTLAVDEGWRVYCNPDFVDRCTVDELAGVFGHEIGHLLRDTAGRGRSLGVGRLQRKRWNIASDLPINDDLKECKVPLPPRVLYTSTFGFDPGLPAEHYYALLESQDPNAQPEDATEAGGAPGDEGPPGGPGGGSPGPGSGGEQTDQEGAGAGSPGPGSQGDPDVEGSGDAGNGRGEPLWPGEGGDCGSCAGGGTRSWEQGGSNNEPDGDQEGAGRISPSAADLIRRAVAREVLAAVGKKAGSVPADMVRWADELLNPVVDWRRVLSGLVTTAFQYVAGQQDYTYRRPSRRGNHDGVVMPSMQRSVPNVAVVVDTSGSMSPGDLASCLSEVEGIIRSVGGHSSRLQVLSCDAAVHTVQSVTSARSVTLAGGGGTDMGAGLDEAMTLRPRPDVIVVLTDGYTPWPAVAPRAQVVVAIIGNETMDVPPWATAVHVPAQAA